jgi:hypothetical protein
MYQILLEIRKKCLYCMPVYQSSSYSWCTFNLKTNTKSFMKLLQSSDLHSAMKMWSFLNYSFWEKHVKIRKPNHEMFLFTRWQELQGINFVCILFIIMAKLYLTILFSCWVNTILLCKGEFALWTVRWIGC